MSTGKLFIVATPIGNIRDITLRALDVLRSVSCVICEEYKQGSKLLKALGVENDLLSLNEHNEKEQIPQVVQRLLAGEDFALISDCGTPNFADPGSQLIQALVSMEVKLVPIPGPSSLMAALSLLDFKLENFVYAGFLPREKTARSNAWKRIKTFNMPIVLLETPYRLVKVLAEIAGEFGPNKSIALALDLTLPTEKIFRGRISDIRHEIKDRKGEFILIIH